MDSVINDRFLKAVGKNIRRIRRQRNVSMEKLALVSNIGSRQLGRIERGEVNASIISILRISKGLDINILFLFEFE